MQQIPQLSTLCYLRDGDKTLMMNRNKRDTDIHLGKWNGLGGKFESGETPIECVTREVLEESGLSIQSPCLRGFLSFPDFKKGEDWYVFVFEAFSFTGELAENHEGELEWIETSKLSELPLWEGDYIFLKWLEKEGMFTGKFEYQNKRLLRHEIASLS